MTVYETRRREAARRHPTRAIRWRFIRAVALAGATVLAAGLVVAPVASAAGGSAPVMYQQPENTTVDAGTTAIFRAVATGEPFPDEQWQVSSNDGATWTNVLDGGDVEGATTNTLLLHNRNVNQDGDRYRAQFSSTAGSVTSQVVVLRVDPVAPTVTLQPRSQDLASGQDATFTAAATGAPTPTVQWQVSSDAEATWADIDGATGTTLTLAAVSVADNGNWYRAVFTNPGGTVPSSAATLRVTGPQAVAPYVTAGPSYQQVDPGQDATFTAAATGTPTPTVQWQVSSDAKATWADIDGATGTTLTLAAVSVADNGNWYRAVFTNPGGTDTSSAATLIVNGPRPVFPWVAANPLDVSVRAGQDATFTAAATGTPTPTVAWEVSSDSGATWSTVVGATELTLTLHAVLLVENGNQYRAVFTNVLGSAPSLAATLTVALAPTLPQVTAQPQDSTVSAGATATFTATASGDPAPTVQWQVSTDQGATWTDLGNIEGVITGATDTTLTVLRAAAAQSGAWYRARFRNSADDTVFTDPATLTVIPAMSAPQDVALGAVAPGATSVAATWGAPDHRDGLTGYRVTPIKDGVAQSPAYVDSPVVTSLRIDDLALGVRYRFEVVAVYGAFGVGPAASTATIVLVAELVGSDSNSAPDGNGDVVVQGASGSTKDTTASANGTGKLVLTPFTTNPAAPPPAVSESTPVTFDGAQAKYLDIYVADTDQGDPVDFSAVTVRMCGASSTDVMFWWNPAAGAEGGEWVTVAPTAFDAAAGCLTATLNNTDSSPRISELTGTMVAVATAVRYAAPGDGGAPAGGAGSSSAAAGGVVSPGTGRIAGPDRYATAAALALEFADGGTVPAVVVANGTASAQGFDALSANFLAGQVGGPIVLVEADRLPPETAAALKKIVGPNTVFYVMGQQDAVSQPVSRTLEAIRGGSAANTVIRVSGNNRYATSALAALAKGSAAAYSLSPGSPVLTTAIIASGEQNADALAAGPLAFGAGIPVLLTAKGSLSPQVAAAIPKLGVQQVIVLGGTDRVSDAVVASLSALGVSHTVRIAGVNRYDTSAQLYAWAMGQATDGSAAQYGAGATGPAYLANGYSGFPDALAAGPLVGKNRGVLLTTGPSALPAQVGTFLGAHRQQIDSVLGLGGPASVSDAVLAAANSAIGD